MFPIPQPLLKTPVIRQVCLGIWRWYAATFRLRYSVERRTGLLFLIDRENFVDRHMLVRGFWERELIEKLNGLVQNAAKSGRRMVFCDIGSHGGLYAMLMQREGVFAEIVAFEPDPVNLAQLHGNLFLNGMVGKIRTHELAASDAAGETTFNVAVDAYRGGSRIDEEGDLALSHKITVRMDRVDALVATTDAIIVGKIDVEGHELQVLAGMPQLLANNHCILQIECQTAERLAAVAGVLAPYDIAHIATMRHDHFFAHRSLIPSWRRFSAAAASPRTAVRVQSARSGRSYRRCSR